jgi:hypothetical protein
MSRATIRKATESQVARRDFLKWGGLVAAALGLERGRYLDVLHDLEGNALADAASTESKLGYLITIVDGTGGLANWTLLFPMTSNAKPGAPADGTFHALGNGVKATQTDGKGELYLAPEVAPSFNAPNRKTQQVAAYLCGTSGAHADAPVQIVSGNNTFMASAAAIQAASSTLAPAIGIGNALYGNATGAPAAATVADANGLIDLFNSASARTILGPGKKQNLTDLPAYHQAMLRLNAASRSPLQQRFIRNSYKAMELLGQQLSDKLAPTPSEVESYGLTGAPNPIQQMGRSLIVGLKAMSLGLTRQLFVPGWNDDPHGLWAGNQPQMRAAQMAKMMDGYFKQLEVLTDSKSGRKMADKTTLVVYGDLYKDPFTRAAWPDACPQATNLMYAIGGQGLLKTGWFGGFPTGETPRAFNPTTGDTVAMASPGSIGGQGAFQTAMAAVLYAVAGGDERRVADFAGPLAYDGLINKSLVTG